MEKQVVVVAEHKCDQGKPLYQSVCPTCKRAAGHRELAEVKCPCGQPMQLQKS